MNQGMNQGGLVPEFQQIAKQLLRISKSLEALYEDQMQILSSIHAQNLFQIDQDRHQVFIMNGVFKLSFDSPVTQGAEISVPCLNYDFRYQSIENDSLEHFFLHDIYFLTGDLRPQNSLFLRNKAKKLRQLLIERAYVWCNGAQRVRDFFHNVSLIQAEIIDHLMIRDGYYQQPLLFRYVHEQQPIPEDVLHIFVQMFSLDVICDEKILSLQMMIEALDHLSFAAATFLPPALYRMMQVKFEERFNLQQFIEHQEEIAILYRHAIERSSLLGFTRLMLREFWSQDDLLAKQHFLDPDSQIWQAQIAKRPVFDYPRVVNWLFKQSAEVLDWLSQNIQHSSVRVAVTALSFVDCSRMHAQVVLATLQYFQYSCARMFIHSCYAYAMREDWFQHPSNQKVCLKDETNLVNDHKTAISPSILYLDEWTGLMRDVIGYDDQAVKRVYSDLSRVMQAYMLHLDKVTRALPQDLMAYIRVETQQNRGFLSTLRRHQIQLNDFRQLFYLQDHYIRESVFDAYVRDYLADYFAQNKPIPKNSTWNGLFLQAIQWHDQIQKQEILIKLRKKFGDASWSALTRCNVYEYQGWNFRELRHIDDIIHESKLLKHCLAASYAVRIIEGEYVAFHMWHELQEQHLTLGCHLRQGQLMVDQLEFAHNLKAGVEHMHIAIQFIQHLNQDELSLQHKTTDH